MSLVIADFDGTLAPLHGDLTEAQIALLTRLVTGGLTLAVVSGAAVESLHRRLAACLEPPALQAVRYYPNNAGSCLRYNATGEPVYEWNDAPAFDPHRRHICAAIGESSTPFGVRAVEHRESQISLTLPRDDANRTAFVTALSALLGPELLVRAAGRRSVDVTLAGTTKARAVQHLAGLVDPIDVVVLGDSFGPGGNDLDLLQPSIAGATVYCAGDHLPVAAGFTVVRGGPPGPQGVYEFLHARFACLPSGARASDDGPARPATPRSN